MKWKRVLSICVLRVYESLDKEQEGEHKIEGCIRTSNGIFHGRNITVEVAAKDKVFKKDNKTLGTSLFFQFGLGLNQGIQAVVPQFLFLNRSESEGLEICMLHRRHASVFDVDCEDRKSVVFCVKVILLFRSYTGNVTPLSTIHTNVLSLHFGGGAHLQARNGRVFLERRA